MADETTRRLASQFAIDRVQIDNRRILGDDLAVPREVEHFAYLPNEQAAFLAAEELGRLGFRTSTMPSEGHHTLYAARSDAIDEESARHFVREITTVVGAYGGHYDGWGAPVLVSRRPAVMIPDSPADIDWR